MKKIILIGIILTSIFLLSGCLESKKPYQVAYQEAYQVEYQEPIYTKYYSGYIQDDGLRTYTITFTNYISVDTQYTGKDGWGNKEYTVTLCTASLCTSYPQINSWSISSNSIITGYDTKYRTEYRTAYRTEYR